MIVSDHDEGPHLVVGAGAPADPDPVADDLLQAVVDFVEDLVDAPGNGAGGSDAEAEEAVTVDGEGG